MKINWKFWKKEMKEIKYEDLPPEVQKKVDAVEKIINEHGGEIVSRKIMSDDK